MAESTEKQVMSVTSLFARSLMEGTAFGAVKAALRQGKENAAASPTVPKVDVKVEVEMSRGLETKSLAQTRELGLAMT